MSVYFQMRNQGLLDVMRQRLSNQSGDLADSDFFDPTAATATTTDYSSPPKCPARVAISVRPHTIPITQSNSLTITGEALAQCLQESDCIMVDRHSPRECLSSPLLEQLPTQCQQLRKGFSECK